MINIILLAAGNSTRFGSNKLLYKVKGIPMYQKTLSTYIDTAIRCKGKVIFVTQYDDIINTICNSLNNSYIPIFKDSLNEYSYNISDKTNSNKNPEFLKYVFNKNHIIKNNHSELGISYSIKLGIQKAQALNNKYSGFNTTFSPTDLSNINCISDKSAILKNNYYLFSVCDQPFIKSETISDFIQNYILSSKGIGCMSYKDQTGNPAIFDALYLRELLSLSGDVGGKKIVKRHIEDVFLYPIADYKELLDLDTVDDISKFT